MNKTLKRLQVVFFTACVLGVRGRTSAGSDSTVRAC